MPSRFAAARSGAVVRLQPGLWLAWAVMITALLMALAPQWFTSANPLEGIPGAQRLAPQAHYLAGHQTSWAATCGRGWFTARYILCRRR